MAKVLLLVLLVFAEFASACPEARRPDRSVAKVSAPVKMTVRETLDLYMRVGKKLQKLDQTAAPALFARYRVLQIQRMLGAREERVRGIEALIAIEREADRI